GTHPLRKLGSCSRQPPCLPWPSFSSAPTDAEIRGTADHRRDGPEVAGLSRRTVRRPEAFALDEGRGFRPGSDTEPASGQTLRRVVRIAAAMALKIVLLAGGGVAGVGVVFGLRFGLDLYANVRPTKLYPNVRHKIHDGFKLVWEPGKVDFVIVRENTEGLYTPTRGFLDRGGVKELAVDSRVI